MPALAQRRQQPPPVQTTYSVPAAAAPGATTELTFRNVEPGEPVALWTSFPANTQFVAGESGRVRCRMSVGRDVPVGIGAVRLYTRGGASSVQLLMIDDLPSVEAAGKNRSIASAQPITPPVAVDGAVEPVTSDYYRLVAKKGQRISIEAVAQRLGSRMDGVLRLLTSDGREVAYCDDSPGAESDPRIVCVIPSDGEFLIELRDVNYEGGADYRYRLRVGDFPLIAAALPLGAARGREAKFSIDKLDGGSANTVDVKMPRDLPRAWVNVKGRGSGFFPVVSDDTPDVVGREDNTAAASATPLSIPSAVSGRFDKPGVRRFYGIAAKKGDRLTVRARTRSLGLSCDAVIQFFKQDGSRLAMSKPATAEDAAIEAVIPADGTYLLRVEELSRAAGPGTAFRLEVERGGGPDFGLSVETEKVNVAAGGTFRLKVACTRRDFDGAIALSLKGDAAGFNVKNASIPAGKKETEVEVRVPAGVVPGAYQFTLTGAAKVGNTVIERQASTGPALKLLFPRMFYPPPEIDGLIGVGIRK
jgi:hypothetical protein